MSTPLIESARDHGARLGRALRRNVAETVATISLPVSILFALSIAFSMLVFGHGDLNHTVGSSYAFLSGHWADFYSYNKTYFGRNDYFPSIYVVFAAWMAPVKLLTSPGAQNGLVLSAQELLWARLGLVLVFAATVELVRRIARELFPEQATVQRTVVATYLLSPFIAYIVGAFGQYDIVGVFFTLLGFLYYLRGDRWRFALFFALAASFKYFALLVFAPLLVLGYKKLREMIALSSVAVSVILLEAAAYAHDPAFRSALWGMVKGSVGATDNQSLKTMVLIVFALGLVLLWRTRASGPLLGRLSVYSAATVYGLMFLVVTWNMVWFVILAPFFALSVGYVRRPGRFIVWESLVFTAYTWVAATVWTTSANVGLVSGGALHALFGPPHLHLSDIYAPAAVPELRMVLTAYFISPVLFWLADQVDRRRDRSPSPRTVARATWALRAATPVLVFTLPVMASMTMPMRLATAITPVAPAYVMAPAPLCVGHGTSVQPISDSADVVQTIVSTGDQLAGVSVLVGTYGKVGHGTLTITVRDGAGTTVDVSATDLARVADNSQVYALFAKPEANSKGTTFTIVFHTSGVAKDLALWSSAEDCTPDATLTNGGQRQVGDLLLTEYYPGP